MRRRRKRDIIIELTALLDVIMIMIFMVMKENSTLIVDTQNQLEAAQQENAGQAAEIGELMAQLDEAVGMLNEGNQADLLERLRIAESMLAGYQSMDDVVVVLNVSLQNRYSNAVRYLTYGSSADINEGQAISIRSDSEFTSALNQLKVFVSDYAQQHVNGGSDSIMVYVIFSYDPDKIYQRDFDAINNALNAVESRADSANFRYQLNPSS